MRDATAITGAVLLSAGTALAYPPAGLIVLGLLLLSPTAWRLVRHGAP